MSSREKEDRLKTKDPSEVTRVEEALWASWRRLVPLGRSVLLAVSGGADSLTLLSACARLSGRVGLRFEAATVDHGLRSGSTEEAAQVGAVAARLGVPHRVLRVNVAVGAGLEAEARRVRYEALLGWKQTRGLDLLATAHTASDQAETLLMRLARGAALGGAAGVREAREDGVVRPLLFAPRAWTEDYVRVRGLPVVRDPMNDDRRFLRVRMRREVVPALEAAAPTATRALARFAGLAAEDDRFLQDLAEGALRRLGWPDGTLEAASVAALERPLARRVLARWLGGQGVEVDAEVIELALGAVGRQGAATLPGDRVLRCENGRVRVEPAPPRRLHATSS